VHGVIAEHPRAAIFFFLHGRLKPPGVVGHAAEEIIGAKTAKLLRERVICGTCYSLNGFAQMATARRATVIGYDGEMFVPTKLPMARQMKDAALAAQRALNVSETAAIATSRAREAYRNLADKWYSRKTIEAQVHAAVANANADSIGFKGRGAACLT